MNGRTNTSVVTIDTGGTKIPLEAPSALATIPMDSQVKLTWKDPLDKYAAPKGETADDPWDIASKWDHSTLIRKAGSDPTDINDGKLITESNIRDQYITQSYSDADDVINGTEYHYAIYGVTTDGIVSNPMFATALPRNAEFRYKQKFTVNYPEGYETYHQFSDFNAGASTTSHAIFVGLAKEVGTGAGTDYDRYYPYNRAYVFDKSGTKSELANVGNISNRNRYHCIMSTSVDGYAFFGGGWYSGSGSGNAGGDATGHTVIIDQSLTVRTQTLLSRNHGGAAGVDNKAIFFGGGTDVFTEQYDASVIDISGTVNTISNAVSEMWGRTAGASTNNHAIFAGYNDDLANGQSHARGNAVAYDSALTKITPASITARCDHVGVSNNGRAVFAGGHTYGYGTYDTVLNSVEYYNDSLTKASATGLINAVYYLAGVSYGNNVLFAGGRGSDSDYTANANLYDGSLTRKTVSNLGSARGNLTAATAENVAYFIGNGAGDAYVYE